MRFLKISVLLLLLSAGAQAQQKTKAKYPSLLWQITGNGLSKPSYLFGTMHVSSKLAFHLSDSFYYALKNVDAVALELNPESWQPQMVRLNDLNQNYSDYIRTPGVDFITENSFRITKYDDFLKSALSTEPPVVNSLLYRSYQTKEDFEEDTFLDLYIFQTGRKLGKAPAGVEDYYESEKLVLEAYADMAKEKKKKEIDLDGESMASLVEKMQSAYRRGDLDLMDSLDNMMESSVAFREKFLYKRNDIQANSIDSIIRKTSLFAGVGAAHLAGDRGVIELLRKKGYTLRPIKMADRDANQKDNIDKLKVKVNFSTQHSPDGMYSVDVPGQLYVLRNAYMPLDRSQFADMNNGSYYLVTRVKTNAAFVGFSVNDVQKKIDSVLYENIPGKILSKTIIKKDGYDGYDISNRTRRGDLQRYQIFITPFEILIFKMSGKNDYVAGEEATRFFNSIKLRPLENKKTTFSPEQKGFSLTLPQQAHQYYEGISENRWEYEAQDTTNGDAYLILKKSVYNYNFIEEDTFDLSLIEESFRGPDYFDKQISRKQTTLNGYPALFVKEKLKNGQFVDAVYLIKGPHYYAFAKRSKDGTDTSFSFINSLKWENFKYSKPTAFIDSFFHFKINTPVTPQLDEGIRTLIEQATADASNGNNASGNIMYWTKEKNSIFRSDSTGEMISVQVQEYPKYFYISDSARFWKNVINDYTGRNNDLVIRSKSALNLPKGSQGYFFTLQDTGSARIIERMLLLKDKYLYSLSTITDTLSGRSDFVNAVFGSFVPYKTDSTFDPYENKLPLFFTDLFSTDSALHKKAQQAIQNVFYGSRGATDIYRALDRLSINDKDYFDTKAKLLAELGYIKDSVTNDIPDQLKKLYVKTADTTLFQSEIIKSLARLKTAHAYKTLKEIMLQDPPIFNDDDDYSAIFNYMEDTLALSATMFPDLLKLSALADYKEPVTELLVMLVDSGFIKSKNYKDYLSSIYIDAKVAQKKQKAADEQKMQQEKKKEEDDDDEALREYSYKSDQYGVNDYAVLLMPFYDKDANVRQYFDKLLQGRDQFVKLNASILMLRNKKDVPDTVFNSIVQNEKMVGSLYKKLEKIDRLDKFPAQYKDQVKLARSYMLALNNYAKMDSIVLLDKQNSSLKGKDGVVYFFKYRVKKTDDWKIGMSGLQPKNVSELSSNDDLSVLTDKKFREYDSKEEQLGLQLKKVLFGYHKSARNFFVSDNNYNMFKSLSDYED